MDNFVHDACRSPTEPAVVPAERANRILWDQQRLIPQAICRQGRCLVYPEEEGEIYFWTPSFRLGPIGVIIAGESFVPILNLYILLLLKLGSREQVLHVRFWESWWQFSFESVPHRVELLNGVEKNWKKTCFSCTQLRNGMAPRFLKFRETAKILAHSLVFSVAFQKFHMCRIEALLLFCLFLLLFFCHFATAAFTGVEVAHHCRQHISGWMKVLQRFLCQTPGRKSPPPEETTLLPRGWGCGYRDLHIVSSWVAGPEAVGAILTSLIAS